MSDAHAETEDRLSAEVYGVQEHGIVRVIYYRNDIAVLMLHLDPDTAIELADEQRRVALQVKGRIN
jgi:hypothetical protein